MKKAYLSPQTQIVNVGTAGFVAVSLPIDGSDVDNSDKAKAFNSFDFDDNLDNEDE